jgi:regulator of protease activity HflC (stomatin/prohibitin superfamily)
MAKLFSPFVLVPQ